MPESAAVILLSEALAHRERAQRAREAAKTMYQRDVIDLLKHFAREFEQRADELEQRVLRLSQETATCTERIAAEMKEKIGKTTEAVTQLQDRLAKMKGGSTSDGQGA